MIEVRFREKSFMVPSRWEEVNLDRFLRLGWAFDRFESVAVPTRPDFERFKIDVVGALLGLDLSKSRATETLCENVFRLSEVLDFPFDIVEGEEGGEVRLDIVLDRQVIPSAAGRVGYSFSISDGVAETSLTAEQYVDAVALMRLYSSGRKPGVLDRLFGVLYAKGGYSPASVKAVRPKMVPPRFKTGAYYNFRGILEWVRRLPKYDIIFNRSEPRREDGASPMGMEGSLYTLAKSGYGSYSEICALNLFTYLDLLLQQSMESVRQLKGCGLKPTEIAEKTGLSVDQISTVL